MLAFTPIASSSPSSQSFEMYYRAMALANGVDPASGDAVAMNITNPTYANSLEDIVLQPVEKQGMDFWWIDWQQGGDRGVFIRNVNPTIWLNHIRSTDHLRRGEDVRGWVLGRFGGLGNHRYVSERPNRSHVHPAGHTTSTMTGGL